MRTSIITPLLVVTMVAMAANTSLGQFGQRGSSFGARQNHSQRMSRTGQSASMSQVSRRSTGNLSSTLPSSSSSSAGRKTRRQYSPPSYGLPSQSQATSRTYSGSISGSTVQRLSNYQSRGKATRSSAKANQLALRHVAGSANRQLSSGKKQQPSLGAWMDKSSHGHRTIPDPRYGGLLQATAKSPASSKVNRDSRLAANPSTPSRTATGAAVASLIMNRSSGPKSESVRQSVPRGGGTAQDARIGQVSLSNVSVVGRAAPKLQPIRNSISLGNLKNNRPSLPVRGAGNSGRGKQGLALASAMKNTTEARQSKNAGSKLSSVGSTARGSSRESAILLSNVKGVNSSKLKTQASRKPISVGRLQDGRPSVAARDISDPKTKLAKDVGTLKSRIPVGQDQLPTREEPVSGQFITDDYFGDVTDRNDETIELDTFRPDQSNAGLEEILQNGSSGGLDGRNDAASGVGGTGAIPEGVSTNAMGGLVKGTGIGYASEETGEEPSLFEKIVNFFTGGDDEDGSSTTEGEAAEPSDEGSGAAGNTGTAVDAGKTASGGLTTSPTAKQTPSGRATGGLVGFLLTAFTANTDSPDSKRNEFNGWAAFVGAANGKAPLAGSQNLDEETAAVVRGENDTNKGLTPEQQGLPAHLRDPSAGWGDETARRKWAFKTGGGITDPTDDVVAQYDGPPPSNNQEDLTAQYEGPRVDPSQLPTQIKDNRDWEYQPKR